MSKNKGGLGRGLAALIPELDLDASTEGKDLRDQSPLTTGDGEKNVSRETPAYQLISPDLIQPNPYQPRKDFNEEELTDLTASIKEQGILSPLLVVPAEEGFTLVSGERRLRAAKRAGLDEVPVMVRTFSDQEMAQIALIENIQRADLLPIEEGQAYASLQADFQLSITDLADRLGKSRSHISNTMRLLKLPLSVQDKVQEGLLSAGHARALLALDHVEDQEELANDIIRKSLSVRATEEAVREIKNYDPLKDQKKSRESYKAVETYKTLSGQLTDILQTQVKIKDNGKQGRLEISFYGDEDLKRILDALGMESF